MYVHIQDVTEYRSTSKIFSMLLKQQKKSDGVYFFNINSIDDFFLIQPCKLFYIVTLWMG